MKAATIQFEAHELLVLMWAIEFASHAQRGSGELAHDAMAIHHRIQSAWLAIRDPNVSPSIGEPPQLRGNFDPPEENA
jgi:hypothetical protein